MLAQPCFKIGRAPYVASCDVSDGADDDCKQLAISQAGDLFGALPSCCSWMMEAPMVVRSLFVAGWRCGDDGEAWLVGVSAARR